MHNRTAALTAAIIAAALGAVLTSCSGNSSNDRPTERDAKELALAAIDSVTTAPTYRVTGAGTDDNGVPTKTDVCFTRTGDFHGTMTYGPDTADIIGVGAEIYWRAPAPMLAALAETSTDDASIDLLTRTLNGRYIRYAGPDAREAPITSVRDVVDLFDPAHTDDVTKDTPTTIDGQRVIPLRMTYEGGETTTMYVPVEGDPFPVRIDEAPGTQSGETLSTALTRPTEPCTPATPQPDQYLDNRDLETALQAVDSAR